MSLPAFRITLRIAATFTAQPVEPAIQFWARRLGLDVRISHADYNQVFQELLDPLSGSALNEHGANVFLVRREDWQAGSAGKGSGPLSVTAEFAASVQAAAARFRVPSLIVPCPGSGAEADDADWHQCLIEQLRGVPGVHVIEPDELVRTYRVNSIHDAEGDALARIPYTVDFFVALGTALVRRVHRLISKPVKLVAVDADNTLWRGVVGETGVSGLAIDGPHRRLQEHLKALHDSGVLIAVVSKNATADVIEVFERHPQMVLRAPDIVSWKVNWQPKSENLLRLAEDLDLGTDSFVFLDDNPIEIAEVRARIPSVVALEVPTTNEDAMAGFLAHSWILDRRDAATAEDFRRTEMYRGQAQRAELAAAAGSFRRFIEELQLKIEAAPPTPDDHPRLAQLSQRTNQFNATGVRRTESELAHLLNTGCLSALKVGARDRFGDYGLVGLICFAPRRETADVENFLLSCRALGKGIEHRMIAALGHAARDAGCTTLRIHFSPTDRNQPAADFLSGLFGAFAEPHGNDAGRVYRIPVEIAGAVKFEVPDSGAAVRQPSGSESRRLPDAPAASFIDWQDVAVNLDSARRIQSAVAAGIRRNRPDDFQIPFAHPRNPLERQFAEWFAEGLAIEPIGIDDGFFSLGGDSVLAARVLAKVNRGRAGRLPLRAIFEHPTVRALAACINDARGTISRPRFVHVERAGDSCPLSSAQRRMWFLDRFSPGNAAYNIVAARRLTGALDIPSVKTALAVISQRHEVLRSTFTDRHGVPANSLDGPGMAFALEDLSGLPPDQQSNAAAARVEGVAAEPFDLNNGPLARLHLLRLAEREHLAVFVFHHIISDGWSLGIFLREFATFYTEALGADAPRLPELRAQYADLAAWEESCADSGAFDSDLEYWREELRNVPEALNLPTDFPRPPGRTWRGGVVRQSVDQSLRSALETLARDHDATLFMVLAAGWQAFLHRWSGQDDILVGTPVSGRFEPEAEDLIGCFINTLVLRAPFEPELSFADHLKRTRETVLRAFDHQELPFDRLVDRLGVSRSAAQSPFFQVMFVLQNTPTEPMSLPGLAVIDESLHNGIAKFDLVLEAIPQVDGLSFNLEFNSDLFRAETAARMLGCFARLLESASACPASPVADLSLLGPAEIDELIHGFNRGEGSASAPAETVHEWFAAVARKHPQAIAITDDRRNWNYDQLDREANRIAHALQARGVDRNVPVALCLERSAELIAGLLGILKAGGCYVPIDLSYPPERLAFMLEDTQAPVLLTQRSLLDQLPEHRATVLCLDDPQEFPPGKFPDHAPIAHATGDSLIYIIYTSGSTGKPKGCCVTHRNVARLFTATEAWFDFDRHDVWTLFHSHAFDFSVWEIWGALLFGGRLVVVPFVVSRSPDEFCQLLVREGVTVLNQTPSAFRQLVAAEGALPSPASFALRFVIFGGEALEMQSLGPWFARHGDQRPQLVNMYGITETTVHVTYRPLARSDVHGGSVIGIPIPDLRVYILDQRQHPCPIGVPGELYVGGAGVATGYLNRDELTAARFVESPFVPGDRLYRTGDLARFLPGRDIEYLGRIDRQVKIRGFRIELGEIESVLLQDAEVREAAVLARDRPGGKQLVAYIAGAAIEETSEASRIERLRANLRAQVPDYMVPAGWVFLEKFPLTANGKLDTQALPDPVSERGERKVGGDAPRNASEQTLADIWQQVLRVDRVGINSNFFALGGDSILTIQVASLARQKGFPLSPRHLFECQTIGELAALLTRANENRTLATTGASRPNGSDPPGTVVPLTPIQKWFLGQNFDGRDHWNQAFTFETRGALDIERLQAALDAVVVRHDAFRLGLVAANGRWTQVLTASAGPVPLDVADAHSWMEACRQAHQSLSLTEGPLVRAVWQPPHAESNGRLFIVIHHMAVDGVSWRILLSDLEAFYSGRLAAPVTDGFGRWARRMHETSARWREELPYWKEVVAAVAPCVPPDVRTDPGAGTESDADLFEFTLGKEDWSEMSGRAAALRLRVDEMLLGALAMAVHTRYGQRGFVIDLEGHGREEIFDDVDASHTIGWFTALFPVRIALPENPDVPAFLRSARTAVRNTPNRGIGFGVLKFIDEAGRDLAAARDPDIVFNYLGQFDRVLSGSGLFAAVSDDISGWHHPNAPRAHAVEIDAVVGADGLRVQVRLARSRHTSATGEALRDAFRAALQELRHWIDWSSTPVWTSHDFPLIRLRQPEIDRLTCESPDVEDIWPLSPMQELFHSLASLRGGAPLDQWRCLIEGPLDVPAFQSAWHEVINRHALLRSILRHAEERPCLVVRREVRPDWHIEDWHAESPSAQESRWHEFLLRDARERPGPTAPAPFRFAVIHLGGDRHYFLWSVPDLFIDGWSWPLVFGEVSKVYRSKCDGRKPELPPAVPYRGYLTWLHDHPASAHEEFWRRELAGLDAPTALPLDGSWSGGGGRGIETCGFLSEDEWQSLVARAQKHALTPTAFVFGAWAIVLARSAASSDITFGASFAGRPAELAGVGEIVGPCTTNLPVRLRVDAAHKSTEFLRTVRDRIFAISEHQFASMEELQSWSAVPWRSRLFESLVVFQNYQIGGDSLSLGAGTQLREFRGPVHSNYALTLVATPGPDGLEVALVHQENRCSADRARGILEDFMTVLRAMIWETPATVGQLAALANRESGVVPMPVGRSLNRRAVMPRTDLESRIHSVWKQAFGPDVGVEDNFFDVGGHSLLALRVLASLREELHCRLPASDLFQFPTVATLARHLEDPSSANLAQAADRAARARRVLLGR